jgi:hypothetical protein
MVTVALAAGGIAAAWLLYRLILRGLGGAAIDAGAAADSLAVVVVAGGVLAYHAAQLVRDVRVARAGTPIDEAIAPPITEELEIVLPGGTDVIELNERIRGILPPGTSLRVRRRAHV